MPCLQPSVECMKHTFIHLILHHTDYICAAFVQMADIFEIKDPETTYIIIL